MDAYLNTAEQVLFAARRPLRPREILQEAYLTKLVPWHLHGSRQDKTLHARLSEDIARNRQNSRFFRTAAGTFFLRRFMSDEALPEHDRTEYFAPPRRRELAREAILALEIEAAPGAVSSVPAAAIIRLLREGRYQYLSYREITASSRVVAVHSFLIVYRQQQVLSFRTGKFFPASDPLYGRRSVGIGGAVFAADVDMLYESLVGIIANGISELCYGVGLPRRLAERARYCNEVRPWLGVHHRLTGNHPPVIHVVMGYPCPDDFTPAKAALSLNDIRWVDAGNPGNNLDDYDATSRHLFLCDIIRKFIQQGRVP
jgi:hypothetical protein